MKNYDVSKIYEWPFAIQFIVIGLVTFIISYLLFVIDISSLKSQINSATQTEDDLKSQLNMGFQKEVVAVSDVTKLPDLTNTLKQWQSKFITHEQLPELQDQILKYGKDNQLKFNSFNPGPDVKDGNYKKIPISISMTGTYDQIGSFLSQIVNMNYFVKLGDFTISRRDLTKTSNVAGGANQSAQAATQSNSDNSNDESNTAINSDLVLKANLTLEIYTR